MNDVIERFEIVIDHDLRTGKCPFCDRVVTLPCRKSDLAMRGIWAHIRACHKKRNKGDLFDRFSAAMAQVFREDKIRASEIEAEEKSARLAEEKEEFEAPRRKHVVTGKLLMDVVNHLESLLDMMEPYYKQCPDSGDDTVALIDNLNGIISNKHSKSETKE